MILPPDLLKEAEHKLLAFSKLVPDIESVFQHHLHPFFPGLAADIHVKDIHLTGLAEADEPGQDGQLISHSLIEIFNTRYLTGAAPIYLQGTSRVYRVPDSTDRQHLIEHMPVAVLETFVDYLIQHLKWCFTNTLTHFWQTPNPKLEHRTPRVWLERFFMGLIHAEQSLRLHDQTLSATESQAVLDVLQTPVTKARIWRHQARYQGAYEIVIQGASPALDRPLAGAFVLTLAASSGLSSDSQTFETPTFAPSTAAQALLYLPDSGLQAFSSLQALDLELRLRLGDEIQRNSLLNALPTQQRSYVQDQAYSLGYREIYGHVFAQRVDSLIQRQLDNINDAWSSAASAGSANNLDALNDYLTDALTLSHYLNPAGIIQNRYTSLFEEQLPDWLKSAPQAQKERWRQAVASLNHEFALSQAPGMPRTRQSGNRTYLLAFARDRLKQRVRQGLGIEIDPDKLVLVTTEALQTGPIVYPFATSGYAAGNSLGRTGPTVILRPIRRSLSEAALDNIGALDLTFTLTATITDEDGKRHSILTGAYLKRIVRELDISTAYRDFLNETLLTSEKAGWRKDRYRALKTAQMRLDTLEARLSGQLTNQQADWVDTLLDGASATSSGATITTQLLMLRYKPVPGVLLIAAQGNAQQLCYLPEAPDHIWFRTFGNLDELAAQLSLPVLRDYVLQRTSVLEQAYINPLLNAGLTDSNTQSKTITGHYLDASYAAEVAFALRNVDEQSTSTREANLQTVKDTVMTVVDIISFALPLKVLIPLSIGRFLHGLHQGIDAVRREQDQEALLHFTNAIAHLTDAGSDFASSRVFASSIRLRTAPIARAFSPSAATLKTPQGMTLLKGDHYRQGVYEWKPLDGAPTEYYLPDANGNLYQATYDQTHNTWLMTDRRMPNASYKTPALEVMGKWKANSSAPVSNQISGIETLIAQARVSRVDVLRDIADTPGIYTLDQRHYIQQNGVVFEVSAGVPGPDLHLILATGSSSRPLVFKIRRNLDSNEWEVKHATSVNTIRWTPLRAGALSPPPAVPALPHDLYLLPREHRAGAEVFINTRSSHQNPLSATFRDPVVERASRVFFQLRLNLLQRAQAFIHSTRLMPRVSIPQFAQATPHTEILRQIYSRTAGLVVGENHFSVASKKFLIDNMGELAKNDVKTLYLEHVQTDLHQIDLDNYAKSGVISHKLNGFLRKLYKREGLDSDPAYTFLTLVTAARPHGIKVVAIDCASTYHIADLGKQDYHLRRSETFSFYGSQVINAHQAQSGAHKWVALVGYTHVNTFEGIPGLAELNGGIGLKVMDTLPGQPIGIGPDKGRITLLKNGDLGAAFYKTDLRLSIEVAASRTYWTPRNRQEIDRLLSQPNQYTFTNHPIDGATLTHRNATAQLIDTPVLSDSDGKVYLHRPEWQDVHNVRFAHSKDLVKKLRDMGMALMR